jgi:hypothetical protein
MLSDAPFFYQMFFLARGGEQKPAKGVTFEQKLIDHSLEALHAEKNDGVRSEPKKTESRQIFGQLTRSSGLDP